MTVLSTLSLAGEPLRIDLTPEGRTATDRYYRYMFGSFAEAMADWPQPDRQDLTRLLGRLADDLSAHLAAADRSEEQPG
jgi:hypothetical protein